MLDKLPENVIKLALAYVPRGQTFTILTSSRAFSNPAKAALYSYLVLENLDRVERLMVCYPDPDEIAGYVEMLEIPGALTGPAQKYIERLIQQSYYLHRLRVGVVASKDHQIPYMPRIPATHAISTLIVGEKACKPVTHETRMIPLEELRAFPNLTNLAWFPVDPRIGTIQHIYGVIHELCPDLVYLQIPWSDQISQAPWEQLPQFHALRQITFRFEHESKITLSEFVKCLHVLYSRNINVRIGSGCAMETVKWLQALYAEIYIYESSHGHMPHEKLARVFQDNRGHLINFRDIPPESFVTDSGKRVRGDLLKESLYQAVEAVDFSDGDGLRLEMDLATERNLPNILLSGKLVYARLLITRYNIPPDYIPRILKANPNLRSLVLAQHIVHCGGSYDGSCTYNKVPLLPKQDYARTSIHGPADRCAAPPQRYTIPGFELLYRLRRHEDGTITQQWKAYIESPWGNRPVPRATELPEINEFARAGEEWPQSLIDRLKLWEGEIKSWFQMCPKLAMIAVVLNTNTLKFGKVEKYWCSCNEYDYL